MAAAKAGGYSCDFFILSSAAVTFFLIGPCLVCVIWCGSALGGAGRYVVVVRGGVEGFQSLGTGRPSVSEFGMVDAICSVFRVAPPYAARCTLDLVALVARIQLAAARYWNCRVVSHDSANTHAGNSRRELR